MRGAYVLAVALAAASVATVQAETGRIEVITRADNPSVASDTVVLRFRGTIAAPMAADLADVWSDLAGHHARVLLDLDSPGGSLAETGRAIAAIAAIRETARIDTLVRHGAMCASACIALFVQGEERTAGGSSVWVIHGACRADTNVPSLALTGDFLDILREAGVSDAFLCDLVDKGYVTTPGDLWLSGYELFHVHKANIITRLLDPWRPDPPQRPPGDPQIGPH